MFGKLKTKKTTFVREKLSFGIMAPFYQKVRDENSDIEQSNKIYIHVTHT